MQAHPPASPTHNPWFSAADFHQRHQRIYNEIGTSAVALVQGAPPVGGFEIFRQTNEFYYLTGVEAPQAMVLLDGREKKSTLYLPHRDEHSAASEGAELAADDADLLIGLSGCDAVAGPAQLEADLRNASIIYTPHNPAEGNMACQDTLRHAAKLIAANPWENQLSREALLAEKLRQLSPSPEIRDLSPILDRMRTVKDAREIALMRHVGKLTALAVVEAMKATRPGRYEYDLAAVADCVYRVNGARGPAYRPIVATADNIWLPHYYRNSAPLRDGELVLMDVAPDVCNYTSDIGRIWPVNGRYTDRQRQLYGFIVQFHQTLLRHIRPGVLPQRVFEEAAAEMRPVVDRMRFATPADEAGVRRALDKDRALTHPVGMAVHDVGTYKEKPFEVGFVFALDPQMWIPEERIYIRVEDTVVVTDNGVENLTGLAPLELDEVEALVRGGGGFLDAVPVLH